MNAKYLRRLSAALLILVLCLPLMPAAASDGAAREVKLTVSAKGETFGKVTDGSTGTAVTFREGTVLTVAAAEPVSGLYIVWSRVPGNWTLTAGGTETAWGQHGFLHEYVPIEGGADSVAITMPTGGRINYIKGYTAGTLPDTVQRWEPSCEKADILLFSTHADDEILFFGGVLPEYAGERGLAVQVVYFSNYFNGTVVREHEKLDGLWACGVRNYPVNGPFDDEYAGSLAAAKQLYGYDKGLSFLVEQLRRFQPQICIAQDVNGEYGHGTHMLTSALMQEAVTVSMDPARCPASAEQYGVWDVPKTYIHLWKEDPITLDCRVPLSAFGGQTTLEVAAAAYKKHVSQQWCWFYVSDTYEYSIAKFGLYRTTVGKDSGNDMMENLISWAEQARLAEEERLAEEARRAEEERLAREEAERKLREEAERLAREEAELLAREEEAQLLRQEQLRLEQLDAARRRNVVIAAAGVAVVAAVALVVVLAAASGKKGKHTKRR